MRPPKHSEVTRLHTYTGSIVILIAHFHPRLFIPATKNGYLGADACLPYRGILVRGNTYPWPSGLRRTPKTMSFPLSQVRTQAIPDFFEAAFSVTDG